MYLARTYADITLVDLIEVEGARNFVFRHHTSNYSTSTIPTKIYIKTNTGDGRELSPPCDVKNRTQGTVDSRPPLLYKAEDRGR